MSTVNYSTRMTGFEAKEWIRNCLVAMGHDHDDEEFIEFIGEHKPTDFKAPRKPRAAKKSSEDRAVTEYDCQLCDARVWNDSLGAQCTRKKKDDECLCTIHLKEEAKNDGALRNGLYNSERPTHAFDDEEQALLPCHDVEVPKKVKKSTDKTSGEKKARKCGNCGECGHNKKTCPSLDKNVDSTAADMKKKIAEMTKKMAEMELKVEEKVEETVEKVEEKVEKVEEKKEEENLELDEDNTDDCGEIIFEGVTYTFDSDDGKVYDDEVEEVGGWNGETITFDNAMQEKLHKVRKKGLKSE